MSKNTILKGTLILTIAGLLTRFIGFFYKIFLSKALGPELLGLYSLLFPIYGICFTIYASGIQTGISKMVAEELGKGNKKNARRVLKLGLLLSVSLALLISFVLLNTSEFVAKNILLHKETAPSLRILAYVFPFCGITSCINGYYYGLKKAFVPATTQLLEQLVRVAFVYIIAMSAGGGSFKATCELAVAGIVVGELASNVYNILSLVFQKKELLNITSLPDKTTHKLFRSLVKISLPLTSNRLFISVLHSFEVIMIPALLIKSGMTNAQALSLYGILTGMTLPFLLFPSTLTNSLSVLLLPAISEAQAKQNSTLITKTVSVSLKYSLILGIFSTGFFVFFGRNLGMSVFGVEEAGTYLIILAWLCPFLYTATTLSSIINGLGKAHLTFLNSIIGLSFRIVLLAFMIPTYGIWGYFISLLVSQLLITGLDVFIVCKNITFTLDAVNSILKPSIIAFFATTLMHQVYQFLQEMLSISDLVLILLCCFVLTLSYVFLLKATGAIRKGEWKNK